MRWEEGSRGKSTNFARHALQAAPQPLPQAVWKLAISRSPERCFSALFFLDVARLAIRLAGRCVLNFSEFRKVCLCALPCPQTTHRQHPAAISSSGSACLAQGLSS